MKKWEVLNETDVSPSHWFPIKQHEVRLPNGTIVDDYYITTLPPVAMVLAVTVGNMLVLVNQYKHGLGEFMFELPAGFQQENKSIEETALAELEEETGIRTTIDNLFPLGKFSNIPTKSSQITHGFLARGVSINTQQNLDITEEIEVVLKSPMEVIEMIKDGDIWVADTVSVIMKAYLLFPDMFQ